MCTDEIWFRTTEQITKDKLIPLENERQVKYVQVTQGVIPSVWLFLLCVGCVSVCVGYFYFSLRRIEGGRVTRLSSFCSSSSLLFSFSFLAAFWNFKVPTEPSNAAPELKLLAQFAAVRTQTLSAPLCLLTISSSLCHLTAPLCFIYWGDAEFRRCLVNTNCVSLSLSNSVKHANTPHTHSSDYSTLCRRADMSNCNEIPEVRVVYLGIVLDVSPASSNIITSLRWLDSSGKSVTPPSHTTLSESVQPATLTHI